MDKTNAYYIIKHLKRFNFPLPGKELMTHEIEEILNELDRIEQTIPIYKNLLSQFNPNQ